MKQIIICLSWYLFIAVNSVYAIDKNYKSADRLLEIFESNQANIYKQKVIVINDHAFAAVYDTAQKWFVFYRPVAKTELPAAAIKKLNNAYKGYSIYRSVMFMNEEGQAVYYSQLVKRNKQVIITSNDAGNVEVKFKPLYKSS